MNLLYNLKGSYITVFIIIAIVLLIMGCYDSLAHKEYTAYAYFHVIFFIVLIGGLITYINTLPDISIPEEIMTGPPSF
jgi:uncharacterized membrane-anchored protein